MLKNNRKSPTPTLPQDAFSIDPSKIDKSTKIPFEYVSISKIIADPNQPRKLFKEVELKELVDTIEEHGVIQPVLLTPIPTWDKTRSQVHTLIVGERRWRAAQMAGLEVVPAIIRDVDAQTALELQLVENVTRVDFSFAEAGSAYKRLVEDFGYTLEQIGKRVGKHRSTISKELRVFNDPILNKMVENNKITFNEAQEMLAIKNRSQMHVVAKEAAQAREKGVPMDNKQLRKTVKAHKPVKPQLFPNVGITTNKTYVAPPPNQQAEPDPIFEDLKRFTILLKNAQAKIQKDSDYTADELEDLSDLAIALEVRAGAFAAICQEKAKKAKAA